MSPSAIALIVYGVGVLLAAAVIGFSDESPNREPLLALVWPGIVLFGALFVLLEASALIGSIARDCWARRKGDRRG